MPVKDVRVQDRGSFFDDSFFKESWDDFDRAMKNVVDKFDNEDCKNPAQTRSRPECQDLYRNLRKNKIDEDIYASQAIKVTEKDGNFQAVVDVRDFNPRDLQVKLIDEKVVLEGRYDKVTEDGKSSSSKAFYREFTLPDEADVERTSTALSKDGVLTIRAPKKDEAELQEQKQQKVAKASNFLQGVLNEHRQNNGSQRNENRPFNSLHSYPDNNTFQRDFKDKLFVSDKDSGVGSISTSPIPSGLSNVSSCASPDPSETGSERSRTASSLDSKRSSQPGNIYRIDPIMERNQRKDNSEFLNQNIFAPSHQIQKPIQPKASPAVGSGGTASISVKEEDGKRTMTSEKSSLVQQQDGYLESKEIAAEVTEKENQAARREAVTRMLKKEEDPDGRFKKSEKADASDVSESCVQKLPDGSVVTVKKSSTSTSNTKQFYSSTNDATTPGKPLMDANFPDIRSDFFNRRPGESLLSQMSSDSLRSNMSSDFSNMSSSNYKFPQMPNLMNDLDSSFSNSSLFSNRTSDEFSSHEQFSEKIQDSKTSKSFLERAEDRPRPSDRFSERPQERPFDRFTERAQDRRFDNFPDRAQDRTSDMFPSRMLNQEQFSERVPDRATDMFSNRMHDRFSDQRMSDFSTFPNIPGTTQNSMFEPMQSKSSVSRSYSTSSQSETSSSSNVFRK